MNSVTAAQARGPDRDFVVGFAAAYVLWCSVCAAVWGLGRFSFISAARAERARQRQAQAAADALHAERLRLARELHDIVASSVSVMIMQAAGARTLTAPGDHARVATSLGVIETAGVQAMKELHRLLGLLRSVDPTLAGGDGSADQPGLRSIPALIELVRSTGLDVGLVTDGDPRCATTVVPSKIRPQHDAQHPTRA